MIPTLCTSLLVCGFLVVLSCPASAQYFSSDSGTLARIVAFGGPQSAGIADPTALLYSPAALAALRDTQILFSAKDLYSLSFLGASSHVPLLGTFAAGVSRLSTSTAQKRISLGWARHAGRRFSVGLVLHESRVQRENYLTGSAGLEFHSPVPGALTTSFAPTGDLFNRPALPFRYAFGVHVREIRLGQEAFAMTTNVGGAARFGANGPSLFASVDIQKDEKVPQLAISVPVISWLMVNGGVRDFRSEQAALGVTLLASNYNLDLVYGFDRESLLLSFGFRLSALPATIARSHLERGTAMAKSADYRKALKEMRRYLVFEPENAATLQVTKLLSERLEKEDRQIDVLMQQADQFERKSWYISATINYLKVLQLDKNHARATRRLREIEPKVDIYINQMYTLGVQAFEQGNIPQARRAFENIALVRKNHADAKSYLQRIIDIQSKDAEDYFLRGLGYFSQKNYPKSIEAFQQALALNPDYPDAQQYLDKAQKEVSNRAFEVVRLIREGDRLTQRKEHTAAYQKYQQALVIDPTNPAALEQSRRLEDRVRGLINEKLQAGEREFQRGNFAGAGDIFRQVLNIAPRDETAKGYVQRIEQQDRQRVDDQYRRGMDFLEAKDYDQALSAFESALALDPNHTPSRQKRQEVLSKISVGQLLARGKAFYQQNQFAKAMEVFGRARDLDPSNTDATTLLEDCQNQLAFLVDKYFNQGMDYYTAEDYREAIKMWDKALEIKPGHEQSRTFKEKALERLQALEQLR